MIRALLVAVAILVAALGWSLWRAEVHKGGATEAQARAVAAEATIVALQATLVRDALANDATDTARGNVAEHHTEHQTRAERVETIAHAPREPVPAVCPGPDADLVRESADAADRIRAAEGRLRGLRPAADSTAGGAARQ